jgi:hypothetical protein
MNREDMYASRNMLLNLNSLRLVTDCVKQFASGLSLPEPSSGLQILTLEPARVYSGAVPDS